MLIMMDWWILQVMELMALQTNLKLQQTAVWPITRLEILTLILISFLTSIISLIEIQTTTDFLILKKRFQIILLITTRTMMVWLMDLWMLTITDGTTLLMPKLPSLRLEIQMQTAYLTT